MTKHLIRQRGRGITALAVLVVAISVILQVSPANAHSELSSSNPADGAQLATVPADLTLTFNQNISRQYASVVLTPAGGAPTELEAEVDGPRVNASRPTVTERPGATRWTLAYRVVSEDGHPITGEIGFTVNSSKSTTTPEPSPSATPSQEASASGRPDLQTPTSTPGGASPPGGIGMVVLIAVVGAAALGIPALLLLRRRARR